MIWLLITAYGVANIRSGYFLTSLSSNSNIKEKKIAITFDDGPNSNTIKILEILDTYNVKATFFVLGNR